MPRGQRSGRKRRPVFDVDAAAREIVEAAYGMMRADDPISAPARIRKRLAEIAGASELPDDLLVVAMMDHLRRRRVSQVALARALGVPRARIRALWHRLPADLRRGPGRPAK